MVKLHSTHLSPFKRPKPPNRKSRDTNSLLQKPLAIRRKQRDMTHPSPSPNPTPTTPALATSDDDYDISNLISPSLYYTDPTISLPYEKAVHELAGPLFLNRANEGVEFEELDWDVQCGMITALTRPIGDKEEYIRFCMPKGRWSDYDEYRMRSRGQVELMSEGGGEGDGDGVEEGSVGSSLSPGDNKEGASVTTGDTTSPDTPPTGGSDTRDNRRKDSARSAAEKAQIPQPQPQTPNRRSRTSQDSNSTPRSTPPHHHRRSNPHEKITFVDELQTIIARRRIPGVENSWHASKYRVSPTMAELRPAEVLVSTPRLRSVGDVRSWLFFKGMGRAVRDPSRSWVDGWEDGWGGGVFLGR